MGRRYQQKCVTGLKLKGRIVRKANYARQRVKKAKSNLNPLMALGPKYHTYQNNELTLCLQYIAKKNIDSATMKWIFDLVRENMMDIYNSCSWGWSEAKKFKEMTHKDARYLIVKKEDGTLVAFSHFRFDIDYGSAVLYCYEVQLHTSVRRMGLGKFVMTVLEELASTNRMDKVVLTVLTHNTPSVRYVTDTTNPNNTAETIPYEILSKANCR